MSCLNGMVFGFLQLMAHSLATCSWRRISQRSYRSTRSSISEHPQGSMNAVLPPARIRFYNFLWLLLTRYYILRERPTAGSRSDNIMEDLPIGESGDGALLGLPESETDLDVSGSLNFHFVHVLPIQLPVTCYLFYSIESDRIQHGA